MNLDPVSIVRVILEDLEGRILLLKRVSEGYGKDQWCLPGGKIDYNKKTEQACIDETKEETNLDISDLKFLFYQDGLPISDGEMHCVNLYFSADYSGKLVLNKESSEFKWVNLSEIYKYDIAFRNDEAITQYLSEYKKRKRLKRQDL